MVHSSPLELRSYMVALEELCLMTSILSMVPSEYGATGRTCLLPPCSPLLMEPCLSKPLADTVREHLCFLLSPFHFLLPLLCVWENWETELPCRVAQASLQFSIRPGWLPSCALSVCLPPKCWDCRLVSTPYCMKFTWVPWHVGHFSMGLWILDDSMWDVLDMKCGKKKCIPLTCDSQSSK